ncbi:aminotransferase class III-fold pyridoxal phosphate-dependent enzyme [Microbacterium lacticum]|uniref:aminotransferase class III-fold pyridoxal phosphate-dependent enzyme n=1 Tax=Microbacterium lacticum TaxID=33885 RepID=UPI001F509E55|nr:aminotransferase class III-fold pyridoxal phosphate-dependent enzyme [Microbacterium lacticum]MBF9336465.1 aminotransferase class III-fold pyridoxal phosphate-dependent enzyme [Microbacterium lacticum]
MFMTEPTHIEQTRRLVTAIPGPKSVALGERRHRVVSAGAGTLAPVYMEQGSGAVLVDVDGNQFVDLGCGIGVTTIGHAHPAVRSASDRQLAKLSHTLFTVTPHVPYVELCERLAQIVPGDHQKKSILVNSGAEAVENAVKIARKFTGRQVILALEHAFHGRTSLTMSMTYRPWPEREGLGPLMADVRSVPSSYPYRDGHSGEEAALRTIDHIERHIGASSVAALFVEPIQGDGGVIIPASGYLRALAAFCRENGILFVADEIQAGIARTGAWYSIEHEGVIPDLVTTAKGLAGGLPLAAVTGRADVMDSVQPGGIGGTFGGNPAAAASALAVLDLIQEDRLLERASHVERLIREYTAGWVAKYEIVGEVRGRGAMFGIELVEPSTGRPAAGSLTAVISHCIENGVIALDSGTWDNVLRIMPSVLIEDALLKDALSVIEIAIEIANSTALADRRLEP